MSGTNINVIVNISFFTQIQVLAALLEKKDEPGGSGANALCERVHERVSV